MNQKETVSYVRERLYALQDEEYKAFQAKLMPNIAPDTIIGVRTPALRALAKELKRDFAFDEESFLQSLPHDFYEENNLHGFLLEMEKDYDRLIRGIDTFLPYVDNWATCDMMKPKLLKRNKDRLLGKIKEWMASKETYTIRFGIEALMNYYLDDDFQNDYLLWVAELRCEEYYVNMMMAWFFATALAKQYEAALPVLQAEMLDTWVHNKTIQKAVESYRITEEQKTYLRTLRRKDTDKVLAYANK